MPKKVTKKLNIPVPAKKMGFWVNKENLRKGERTIKTKRNKVLVKRDRSGYEYSKTFTGYELDKDNLELQFASRRRVNPQAAARDLKIRAQDTRDPPVLTVKQFFDFTKRDVEGIDTPPKTAIPSYKNISDPRKFPDRAYVGLMWKAKGTYRGENINQHWFLVTNVHSGGQKVDVVRHPDAKKMTLPFTQKTVKWPIADMNNDFSRIGEKRHKNEVKQFIKKYVGSGYSIANEKGDVIQPTGELITKRGDPRVSYLVETKTYSHEEVSDFLKRVVVIAEDMNVDPKKIDFKDMKGKKWGECTSTGVVRFDPELLEKDKDFQDKTIIHELLHLRYPGHDKMHKQMSKTYIQRYKDKDKQVESVESRITDDLSIDELINITRKNETELARLGMKIKPDQRAFDPTYQHIKSEIAEARAKISEKQFASTRARLDAKKQKPYYILDGTGQILHKSTTKEGADKWFNKFKPTNLTYPEKRWKIVSKEKHDEETAQAKKIVQTDMSKEEQKKTLEKQADEIANLDLDLAKEQAKLKKEIQNSPEVLNKKIDEEKRWRSLYLKEQVIHSSSTTARNKLQKKIDACTKKIDRYEAKLNPKAKALSEEFTVLANKYQPLIFKAQRGLDHKEASKLYSEWEIAKEDLYREIEREIDEKTTEEKVITKEDLSKNRKKTQQDKWKTEPYKSKIDVEEIDTGPKKEKKPQPTPTPIGSNVKEIITELNQIEQDYVKAKSYRPDTTLNYINVIPRTNNIKVVGKPFSKEQLAKLEKEQKITYVDQWTITQLGGYVAGTGWYLTTEGLEEATSLGLTIRDKDYYLKQKQLDKALDRKDDKDRIKGDLIKDLVWKNGEWLNQEEKKNIEKLVKIGNIRTSGMTIGSGATVYKDEKEKYIYIVGYNENKKKVKYTRNLEKLIKEGK